MSLLSIDPQLLLSMPSGSEWIIILLVVVIFFGGKKIPELAKGLGKGMREFNEAKAGIEQSITAGMNSKPTPPAAEPVKNTVTSTPVPAEQEEVKSI